ncbi:hypothetical protein Btru_034266, partial [Bulinus truncatus]
VSEEDLMKLFYSHLLDIVGFLLAELFDIEENEFAFRNFRLKANFENIRDYHSKLLTKLALVDSFQPNYSELFHLSKDILDKDPDLNSSPELPPQPEINPGSKTQGESKFDSIELKCQKEGDSCFNLQTTTNDKVEKISCMSTSLDLSSPTFAHLMYTVLLSCLHSLKLILALRLRVNQDLTALS